MPKNSLPPSFSGRPDETPHHYFRNVCLEFIKTIKETKEIDTLKLEMTKLLNAAKEMEWKEDKTKPLKAQKGEKILTKICDEFARYIENLSSSTSAISQDLLEALQELLSLIESETF